MIVALTYLGVFTTRAEQAAVVQDFVEQVRPSFIYEQQ